MALWNVNVEVENRYEFTISADTEAKARMRADAFLKGYLPLLENESYYDFTPEVSYHIALAQERT